MSNAPNLRENYINPDGTLTRQGYALLDYIYSSLGGIGGVSDGDKGDIVVTGAGATWTIDGGAVTLAKQADVATARIMGRVTAGTGVQEALTGTQATTILDLFTSGLKGLVPASGGGTTNFLRADGTWVAPTASAAWGSITGTLSAQTDLQTALDGKATLADTLDEFANPVASLDFAQQQTLQFVIENRTSDPGSPVTGQVWIRTDI